MLLGYFCPQSWPQWRKKCFSWPSVFPWLGRRPWVSSVQFCMKHGPNARDQVWAFASLRVFWERMLEARPGWVPRRGTWKAHGHSLEKAHLHHANRFLISKPKNNLVWELYSMAFCLSKTTLSWKAFNWQGKKVQFWLSHWVWARDARSAEFGMCLCFHWSWRRGSHFQCCLPKPLDPALCSASMSISGKARRVPCPGIRSLQLLVAEESHPGAYLPPPHYPNETQDSTASSVVVFFSES